MEKILKHTFFFFFLMLSGIACAQETFVHFNRDINFGKFYSSEGSSGTICISNSGGIDLSSGVKLIGADAHPASVTISTSSESPIDIKIEVGAERLQGQKGNRLNLTLNAPDNYFYTIRRGSPAEIYLGGCLEITSGSNPISGDYNGVISIDVFILNK